MSETKNFLISMITKHRCACCDVLDKVCRAKQKIPDFVGTCIGKLDERPSWCPLHEISRDITKNDKGFTTTTGSDIRTIIIDDGLVNET